MCDVFVMLNCDGICIDRLFFGDLWCVWFCFFLFSLYCMHVFVVFSGCECM
jgi:hypothetical protein